MNPNKRDPILFIEDILHSMKRVEEYIEGLDFQQFKTDYKTVDAVIRNFEIIGEASRNLSKDFKESYTMIPWEEMYRLRNRISHEYFGIDYEIIWEIARIHLRKNLNDLELILEMERKKIK